MHSIATGVKAIGRWAKSTRRRPGERKSDGYGKVIAVGVMTISLVGCTTLQPIAGSCPELGQQIAVGAVLKPGDRVVIATADGHRHKLAVTAVDSGSVQGKRESVPIDQIVSVQKRVFSSQKTMELILDIWLVGSIVATSLAGPALVEGP